MAASPEQARTLRELHQPGRPLLLANAWDVASARMVAGLGYPVVATTSGAIADSLGYADGEQTPPAEMLGAVARIAAAVDVPVTADLEAGYGLEPEALVRGLLEAGAVGMNIEDSDHAGPNALVDAEPHAERLAAIKDAGRAAGVDVVLNARTDPFLHGVENPLEEALRRGRLYAEAGADCLFPCFARTEDDIRTLVDELPRPVNMLALPDAPPPTRLAELGVARISTGTGLAYLALRKAERVATGLLETQTSSK